MAGILTPTLSITQTADAAGIGEICRFRREVWAATGSLAPDAFPSRDWRDPFDEIARHWVIRSDEGRLLAAARWSCHNSVDELPDAEEYADYGLELMGPIAAPGRVVVCPSAQRQGFGRRLLDVQDRASREAGCRYALRQATPAMARMLVGRGWQILGPGRADPRFPGVAFQVAHFTYQ